MLFLLLVLIEWIDRAFQLIRVAKTNAFAGRIESIIIHPVFSDQKHV